MAPTGCGTEVGTTSEPVPLGPSELGDGTKHGKNPVRTEDDGWMDGWMDASWVEEHEVSWNDRWKNMNHTPKRTCIYIIHLQSFTSFARKLGGLESRVQGS